MIQRALSKYSESTQKALRDYLKSSQREREQSEFVIPSEPKILRLVIYDLVSKVILYAILGPRSKQQRITEVSIIGRQR